MGGVLRECSADEYFIECDTCYKVTPDMATSPVSKGLLVGGCEEMSISTILESYVFGSRSLKPTRGLGLNKNDQRGRHV